MFEQQQRVRLLPVLNCELSRFLDRQRFAVFNATQSPDQQFFILVHSATRLGNFRVILTVESDSQPIGSFLVMALHKGCLIVQNLSDADRGLPPHSAERLGLSGSDLSPL